MANKDWTGDSNSVFKTLGASNHADRARASMDYYATEPKAVELLLEQETFHHHIWECASGEGHIAKVLERHGYQVRQSDIVKRTPETEELDFLGMNVEEWDGDIITNPPYKYAQEFCERALQTVRGGKRWLCFCGCSSSKARQEDPCTMPILRRWSMLRPADSNACSMGLTTTRAAQLPTPGSSGRKGTREIR